MLSVWWVKLVGVLTWRPLSDWPCPAMCPGVHGPYQWADTELCWKWALNVAPGPQNAGRGCLVHDNPIPSRLLYVHSGFSFLALNF